MAPRSHLPSASPISSGARRATSVRGGLRSRKLVRLCIADTPARRAEDISQLETEVDTIRPGGPNGDRGLDSICYKLSALHNVVFASRLRLTLAGLDARVGLLDRTVDVFRVRDRETVRRIADSVPAAVVRTWHSTFESRIAIDTWAGVVTGLLVGRIVRVAKANHEIVARPISRVHLARYAA